MNAQTLPPSPDRPWKTAPSAPIESLIKKNPYLQTTIDPNQVYTLVTLIDLAESHNPATRVAWENTKVQFERLGIARSALYPTVNAVVLASTLRQGVLFNTEFVRQTEGLYQPELELSYLVFDFGERFSRIATARSSLLGATATFNDTHLRLIYQTASAYYRLLNAQGQVSAARANLENARTVQDAVQQRLDHGLATLPDALEARSSAAQADYDLQNATGTEEIARGELLMTVAALPSSALRVQPIDQLPIPEALPGSFDTALVRALQQRPDLIARFVQLQGAESEIRGARSTFFPTLSFQGEGGAVRAYGRQNLLPPVYAGPVEEWDARLALNWRLFDGGARERALALAHSDEQTQQAQIHELRDTIAEQVWTAYSNANTALRRRQAAAALLAASTESYDAAFEAYKLGVRSLLDVVAAQRTLAQARAEDVAGRADVLSQFATLAFRAGDLLHSPPPGTPGQMGPTP